MMYGSTLVQVWGQSYPLESRSTYIGLNYICVLVVLVVAVLV